jgi:ABC-type Co2+ transport system permease subunit
MRDEKMMIYKNLLLAGLLLLFARPAHAMHITEGILPFNWAAAWFVVAAQFWPLCGRIILAFIPTQLPLGLLEGAMTAGMVVLLSRKRPDLLIRMRVIKKGEMPAHA